MFQIEQATKQCAKISLTEPWDPLDIPQNSTFEDQYSIGGPQEQITVQEWSDRKTARSCKDGRIHVLHFRVYVGGVVSSNKSLQQGSCLGTCILR